MIPREDISMDILKVVKGEIQGTALLDQVPLIELKYPDNHSLTFTSMAKLRILNEPHILCKLFQEGDTEFKKNK